MRANYQPQSVRRSLHDDLKCMTAEQRLAAFLAHCQLLVQLARAGAAGQDPYGVVGASLDADAIVAVQVREAQALRQFLLEEGYEVALRTGEVDDPIPGLLEIRDGHGSRVDLPRRSPWMDAEIRYCVTSKETRTKSDLRGECGQDESRL